MSEVAPGYPKEDEMKRVLAGFAVGLLVGIGATAYMMRPEEVHQEVIDNVDKAIDRHKNSAGGGCGNGPDDIPCPRAEV